MIVEQQWSYVRFEKHIDGRITVANWPQRITISNRFLEEVDPAYASVGDGIISFHGVDPPASYALVEHDPWRLWTYAVKSPEPMAEDDD